MVKRLKFRVYGGEDTGKYVYSLREGAEVFLSLTFRPSLDQRPDTWMFLQVVQGKTLIFFLRPGLLWNGAPAERGPVELHPGHLLGSQDCIVEILECPEVLAEAAAERTQFLDLESLAEEDSAPPLSQIEVSRVPRSVWSEQGAVALPTVGALVAGRVVLTPLPSGHEGAVDEDKPEITRELSAPPCAAKPPWAVALTTIFVLAAMAGVHRFYLPQTIPLAAAVSAPVLAPEAVEPAVVVAPAMERAPAAVENPQSAVLAAPEVAKAPVDPAKSAALIEAIRKNDLASVQHALEGGAVKLELVFDEEGRLPAGQAAVLGRVSVLKILLSQAGDVNALDRAGYTPLMWAVLGEREKTVDFLLGMGADPSLRRADGQNALALAQARGHKKIQKLLQDALAKRGG